MMMKKITAALTAMLMLPAIPAPAVSCADQEPASVQAGESAETVSAIGSVSKVFCTAAAMQLSGQGLLNPDAPVTDYVPDFTMADGRHVRYL